MKVSERRVIRDMAAAQRELAGAVRSMTEDADGACWLTIAGFLESADEWLADAQRVVDKERGKR